eukprot:257340-Chlamydomonas_euryale.AAC.1
MHEGATGVCLYRHLCDRRASGDATHTSATMTLRMCGAQYEYEVFSGTVAAAGSEQLQSNANDLVRCIAATSPWLCTVWRPLFIPVFERAIWTEVPE